MAIGHEASGEVAAVGHTVKDAFVGQRVVVDPMMMPTVIGNGGAEGAFAEDLLARDTRICETLHPIPDDLPFDLAALSPASLFP